MSEDPKEAKRYFGRKWMNPSKQAKIIIISILALILVALILVVIFLGVFVISPPIAISSSATFKPNQRSTLYGNFGVVDLYAINVGANKPDNPCPRGEVVSVDINNGPLTRNGIYLCQVRDVNIERGVVDVTTVRAKNPFAPCIDGYTKGTQNLAAGSLYGDYMYLCVKYGKAPYLSDIKVVQMNDSVNNRKFITCPEDGYVSRGEYLNLTAGHGQLNLLCVHFSVAISSFDLTSNFGVGKVL